MSVVIEVPVESYRAGESALAHYPIAEVDRLDAASDVLHAGIPIALSAALVNLADQLTELAEHMRSGHPKRRPDRFARAAGLVEGIAFIREHAAQLRS